MLEAKAGLKAGETSVKYREKVICSGCHSSNIELAIDLEKLPLTGVFLKEPNPRLVYQYDQGLSVCVECGHAQLRNCLAPEAVYDHTYFHRSSASSLARSGNDVFARFVRSVVGGRKFRCLLEIGANDLYLIDKIRDFAQAAIGVDPIWKQEPHPARTDVQVLGKFVEEILPSDLPTSPDLIVSVQTFEHVDEPAEQLARIVELAADDAVIFLEIPDFDSLLRNLRFDQIFHQHVQYFSLASLLRLIEKLGCNYLAHSVNFRYWGGALGVAFSKGRRKSGTVGVRPEFPTPAGVAARFRAFQTHMEEIMLQIMRLPTREIYGFGAAQMVPTLAYHLKSDLGFLRVILDDDPGREGFGYPGLPVRTRRPSSETPLHNAAVLITAVDSARPIMRRLIELDPQHIIAPFPVL
jgi:hypothetical protein